MPERQVCSNCGQWIDGSDCLNECGKRGLRGRTVCRYVAPTEHVCDEMFDVMADDQGKVTISRQGLHWVMDTRPYGGGPNEAARVEIYHCPFCGTRLPAPPHSQQAEDQHWDNHARTT